MGLADTTGKWLFMKADVERTDGSGVAEGLQQRINAKNVTLTEVYNMRTLQDVTELIEPEPQEGPQSPQSAAPEKHVSKWAPSILSLSRSSSRRSGLTSWRTQMT